MVFSSLIFLYLFLPLNLLLYYVLKNRIYRNLVLILFSFVFYAWGEPLCVVLLLFITLMDYFAARLIEKFRGKAEAKVIIIVSVIINLGLLVFFRYSEFIYDNINSLFSISLKAPSYIFPLGISFYTFRSIAYLVDVYRDDSRAERSFPDLLMFMSLYHLVSGPIARYSAFPDEIKQRSFDMRNFSSGATRFCIGLFKKVCIANVAGEFVGQYMISDPQILSIGLSWFGIIMFTLQIYFDFSGYTDMALGLGKMFGFNYPENFNYPYIARSATDFWRRWHITLSNFLRDYLFSPIAVRLRYWGKGGVIVATLITFTICGLWHGPSWNYILWGLYFGILISLELLFLKKFFSKIPRLFSHIYFVFAMMMGWTLFYFTDLDAFWKYLNVMFGNTANALIDAEFLLVLKENIFWLVLAIVLCFPLYPILQKLVETKKSLPFPKLRPYYSAVVVIVMNLIFLFISTTLLVGQSYNAFFYFRF